MPERTVSQQASGGSVQRIVIVGGGAGGLELATKLGRRLGRKGLARVTLVDSARTHVWKPLLHQLAAGSYDTHAEEIEYLAHAHWHHFKFQLGALTGLDRENRVLHLAASHDAGGEEITPEQELPYDTLVLALGSLTNDFGTPGAAQHAIKLDSPQAARRFNERLINAFIRAQSLPRPTGTMHGAPLINVVIVGGGATGVELAAELHTAAQVLSSYGFENVNPESDLKIVLIEAASRLLVHLPERLGEAAALELRKLAVEVHTQEKVVRVNADSVLTESGKHFPATLAVWAAGVKADELLNGLGGTQPLETNRLNQLLVNGNLQTTRDANIYAFGDCAACPQGDGQWVPPRAQAAHQQASYLVKMLPKLQAGLSVPPYRYEDKGSLVSLSEHSSLGTLMGSLTRGSLFVEGRLAQLMYWALHKQHQLALNGVTKTALITLSEWIDRAHRPRIKLH